MWIFAKAIDILIKSYVEAVENMRDVTNNDDAVIRVIHVPGNDHTLGNFLQSTLYNMYVRGKKGLSYVGYYQPHPNERAVVLKIRADPPIKAIDFLKSKQADILKYLNDIKAAFDSQVK
jgi:DNA-directed RNA polymerase subunit L